MKTSILATAILGCLLSQGRWVPDQAWLQEGRPLNIGKGFVTKKQTALAIGRAVIDEKYGKEIRKQDEPYDAKRIGDVWVVYGYFPQPGQLKGGTITAQISATTGTVINVFAEQ